MRSTTWQVLGAYQYEVAQDYDSQGQPVGTTYYTGWYRCIGGRMADGRWPQWNEKTGATR